MSTINQIVDSNYDDLSNLREILDKMDYKDLTGILDTMFPSIPICIMDFDNRPRSFNQRTGLENLVYRARLITNEGNKCYQYFDDITYISDANKHKIVNYGRVNKPGEAMFYCSTQSAIACVETFSRGENFNFLKESGSLLLNVGVWKITQPMTFARMISPEAFFGKFLKDVKGLELTKITLEDVARENKRLSSDFKSERDKRVYEFFSEEYCKTEIKSDHDYKLTNYYADRVFNRNPKFSVPPIDGIWYQSVPSSFQETNFALLPATVDSKLQFLWCDLIWVTYQAGDLKFIPLQQRVKADATGRFNWR